MDGEFVTSTDWSHIRSEKGLCSWLGVSLEDWRQARAESRFNYHQYPKILDGKSRELCHPPLGSILEKVQKAIKERVLSRIEIVPEICGYRKGRHNINVSMEISGSPFVGTLDISKFHPSITKGHVEMALRKHALPASAARRLASIITFRDSVPQGASTSNHIANIVLDGIMRRKILPSARRLGLKVRNYGDDIAIAGADDVSVQKCWRVSKRAIENSGFRTNDKGKTCEHEGGFRRFIGCATGRSIPDYPRDKYREKRRQMRATLQSMKSPLDEGPQVSERTVQSLKQQISYVSRLNPQKARRLKDIFYRICAEKRRLDYSSRQPAKTESQS